MAKYKLINKEGNAIREADSASKRDELIRLGYRDYNPASPKGEKKTKSKGEKKTNN